MKTNKGNENSSSISRTLVSENTNPVRSQPNVGNRNEISLNNQKSNY